MSKIIRVGVDLSKNNFDVCGVDEQEMWGLERTLKAPHRPFS